MALGEIPNPRPVNVPVKTPAHRGPFSNHQATFTMLINKMIGSVRTVCVVRKNGVLVAKKTNPAIGQNPAPVRRMSQYSSAKAASPPTIGKRRIDARLTPQVLRIEERAAI